MLSKKIMNNVIRASMRRSVVPQMVAAQTFNKQMFYTGYRSFAADDESKFDGHDDFAAKTKTKVSDPSGEQDNVVHEELICRFG